MNQPPSRRRQFSLATILIVVGVAGVILGLWTWLRETIPGGLAAMIILCWIGGLAAIQSTSFKFDDNPRPGVLQLMAGLGCGTILVGPLIALVIWSLWNR